MDFDASVFIITSDKQYIPVSEYNVILDDEGVFVMLTNDELNTEFGDDNSICIHRDWVNALKRTKNELKSLIGFKEINRHISCQWQLENKSIPDNFQLNKETDEIGKNDTIERDDCIRKYLDGYRTNQEIMRNAVTLLNGKSVEEYLPAIMVAHHTQVTFDGKVISGYLPVIGQLRYMSVNSIGIYKALKMIGSGQLTLNIGFWWSATEFDKYDAWCLSDGTAHHNKAYTWQVLPLFTI